MAVEVEPHRSFEEIYSVAFEDGSRKLATKNLAPGHAVYGERLIKHRGIEYRIWDPFRSKLAAAIMKGLGKMPIKPNHKVLYLGSASGTTASHVSDIVGEKGHVYCVEFAARSMRDLVNNVCAFRFNMSPILADARLPGKYATLVGKVDDIYCDVAQPEQAKILADNADMFLVEEGWIMLAVKAQSIDVTREPSEIYRREAATLEARDFEIVQVVPLEPYEKAHTMILGRKT